MKEKIKNLFCSIIERIKKIQEQRKIFDNVKVGNMLWCNMPLSKRELNIIEESHRIRPYLVVEKGPNFLLCYQCSSKSRKELNNYEEYCIKNKKYRNKKDSWIDLTNVIKIKIKNIESEYLKLNQIDIKKIEKRIIIGQNRGNAELIRFNEPIYIEVGDVIVRNGETYFIYSEDNVNIYGLKIQKRKKEAQGLKKIRINRKIYYTDFKELKTIKRNDDIEVINITYEEEILKILNKKNELKSLTYSQIEEYKIINKGEFEIGSVFEYGNSKVMYLYEDNNKYYGVDLLWYVIKPRIFEIKNIQRRKLLETKNLEEVKKVLEFLMEKNIKNSQIKKIYRYIRNLLFSSVA